MSRACVFAALLFFACSSTTENAPDCKGRACDDLLDGGDAAPEVPDGGSEISCSLATLEPWIAGGPGCGSEADIQVQALSDDTLVLRQSLCTSFEAPFMYLLFGDDKALLEDTGDGNIDIAGVVTDLVEQREEQTGNEIELVVVNSHAHGDHVQGNPALAATGATLVGTTQGQLMDFFGMSWPREFASYDLGNRTVEIAAIPGHQDQHVVIYDHRDNLLLTGDTFYPGRLYVADDDEYVDSISFLVAATDTRLVCSILGTHVEMSTAPGMDYAFGATHHPDERDLGLQREHLLELSAALEAMGSPLSREVHDDFIVYPL